MLWHVADLTIALATSGWPAPAAPGERSAAIGIADQAPAGVINGDDVVLHAVGGPGASAARHGVRRVQAGRRANGSDG